MTRWTLGRDVALGKEKFMDFKIAKRWSSFGTSIFTEMSQLARLHNAVNLAQGFPDFDGPRELLEKVAFESLNGHNQYAPSIGEASLRAEVAAMVCAKTGVEYCPENEITITTGATEAIYSVVNAFVNPGDRVVVFEPCYDSYAQAVANAGGCLSPVRLHAPDTPAGGASGRWGVDWDEFDAAVSAGFKLLILNTPHNPTGKIFSRTELDRICAAVIEHDALLMSDEVYEYLNFSERVEFLSPAAVDGMRGRVVRISSAAKTFGFTGFKVGWVCAPAELTACVRLVHQAVVFCTNPATQRGLASAMSNHEWLSNYLADLHREYKEKQEKLLSGLTQAGFSVRSGEGSYFLMASFERLVAGSAMSDITFAQRLITEAGVAAIPPSVFYISGRVPPRSHWLRFAFCKNNSTLDSAIERLRRWADNGLSKA